MTKYTDAEGTFISLVGKGANQMPFKIIKQDKGATQMLNLASIVKKVMKGSKDPVEIVAIATTKNPDHLAGILQEEGLVPVTITKSEKDGNAIILEEVDEGTEVHAVKVSENMTVIVKGFTPWADDLVGATSFSEFVQTQSFFASCYDASDALASALRVTMYDADDKEDAKTKVAALLDQYKDYVLGILDGLPQLAFKMDKTIDEAEQKLKAELEKTVTKSEGADTPEPAKEPETAPEPTNTETKTEPEVKTETGTQSVAQPSPTDTNEPKGDDKPADEPKEDQATLIAKAVAGSVGTAVNEALKPLLAAVGAIVQKDEEQKDVIAGLKETVTKAEKKLSTTVAGTVTKSDSTPAEDNSNDGFQGTGCIDTAIHRPTLK